MSGDSVNDAQLLLEAIQDKGFAPSRSSGDPGIRALLTVISHPRFFHIERVHAGHVGDCPQEAWARLPCWHWMVGVGIREGRVSWWEGATWQDAVGKAADTIEGREPFCACGRSLSDCDGSRLACQTTEARP